MAARSLDRTMSAAAHGEENDALPAPTVDDVDDDSVLPTAAIDQTLSLHRASAANFKNLPPQPSKDYRRVHIADADLSTLDVDITKNIRHAVELRSKWLYAQEVPEWADYAEPRHSDYTVYVPPPYDPFDPELKPASDHVCQWKDGVVSVYSGRKSVMRRQAQFQGTKLEEFAKDLAELMKIMNDPECRSFCYRRLMLLQERFNMYLILNDSQESLAQIAVPHRDLYNVRKVDVHGMFTSTIQLATRIASLSPTTCGCDSVLTTLTCLPILCG